MGGDQMQAATLGVQQNNRTTPFIKKLMQNFKRYKFIYLLMLPGVLYFLIFNYYPLYFLTIAFKKFNVFAGFENSPWIGFKNFQELFNTKYFLQSLNNTVILSFMYKAFGFPAPILLALLLNEIRNRYFKRTVQTLIYMPHFLSWVIVGGIWLTLLSPEGGLVNEILRLFGVEPIFFAAENKLFRWVITFTNVWKEAGWGTIIYLAAISGIDQDMYEAATIDGASKLQQAKHITLPSIIPTIIVVFILGLAKVLDLFEQVFVMYNPVVAEVSETIDTYVYQIGLVKGDMSFATAVGLFKNIVSLILVLATRKIANKLQGSSVM